MMYLPRALPAFLLRMLALIWRKKIRMDEQVAQGLRGEANPSDLQA